MCWSFVYVAVYKILLIINFEDCKVCSVTRFKKIFVPTNSSTTCGNLRERRCEQGTQMCVNGEGLYNEGRNNVHESQSYDQLRTRQSR